jgi:drug/metabolite transporter (DMT)-like permease
MLFMVGCGIVSSPRDTLRDIDSIASRDMLILLLIAVIFSIGRIIFSTLLKHHDPRTIKISGYMISTLVSGGALYLMKRKSFTASRYLGFTLFAIGGYLFIV